MGRWFAGIALRIACIALGLAGGAAGNASAAEFNVAAASNFTAAAKEIAAAFEAESGHRALLSFGSTGKLYAQIANGAPFQVFLSADAATPERMEAEGSGVAGTRFTYATGRLVLFSLDPALVDDDGKVLASGGFRKLAIGNPASVPYGAAALAAIKALGVEAALSDRLVLGDNIAQTFQFVATGNAELGFVALSQVVDDKSGSRWVVPADLYPVIRQDVILTAAGAESAPAKAFLAFLQGAAAREIIARYGYGVE